MLYQQKKVRYLFLFACICMGFIPVMGFAKIRILTFHYNQPDFVELQYRTLKKFLLDDFELIVFNDAKTQANENAIRSICEEYGLTCVRFLPNLGIAPALLEFIEGINPGNVEFFLQEHFLHFGAVSGQTPYHKHKAFHLINFLEEILREPSRASL